LTDNFLGSNTDKPKGVKRGDKTWEYLATGRQKFATGSAIPVAIFRL
jgi:hypothetical protein